MVSLTVPNLADASNRELLDDLLIRICHRLQLSRTQYELAKQHYEAICGWLNAENSPLLVVDPDLYPQGSMALGTTVKPLYQEEYDVDLVCELRLNPRTLTSPLKLLDVIEQRLKDSQVYRPLVDRMPRCIRVNYEHKFHLDILPACPDPNSKIGALLIPDCKNNYWRSTNPKGLINWFKLAALKRRVRGIQDAAAAAPLPVPENVDEKNTLQLTVQLLKRMRDVHFSDDLSKGPASVILTVLAGTHYEGEQSVSENLKITLLKIKESIPEYGRLSVQHPRADEDLSEKWDDRDRYAAFISMLDSLISKIDRLDQAKNMGDRSAILRQLFDENIVRAVYEEQAEELEKMRDARRIGVTKKNGIAALAASVTNPIRKNTFYGDQGI
jgi:hypothetical protein